MKRRKMFEYLFAITFVLLVIKLILPELFDNRPFRFEKYKTSEQLEEAVKDKFPIGSDFDEVVSMLKKSAAKCYVYKPSDRNLKMYHIVANCEYSTKIFSLHPFEWYRVWVAGDDEHNLIELITRRISGPMLYIP